MDLSSVKKILSILDSSFKKRAFVLQIYLVIGVLFESVGLGMVIPLVAVITDDGSSRSLFFIQFIKRFTGDITKNELVFVVLGCFVLFYLVKTLFLSFLVWKQSAFTQGLSRTVSTGLYKGYLFQPYSFFMDSNSGVLMKNVVAEISSFTAFVQALMFLQTEISVLVGIVVTLLLLEPVGALIVFSFIGLVSYGLLRFSKKKVTGWGKERQLYDGLRSKSLLQGLSGISELKLFHKENYFIDKYDGYNRSFYESQRKVQYIQQVQRYYIELVLIISIALLAGVVILQGKSLATVLPSLSLFLFASLRLLPSANRIIANLQTMRFTRPGIDLVYREFSLFRKSGVGTAGMGAAIRKIRSGISLQKISFTYPAASRKALDAIDLDIQIGSVIGVIGQSGSGKTTLVNILTGLLQPCSGRILIDDIDITGSVQELQKFIGYVPQHIFLIDDTLKRNIAFGIDDEAIDETRLAQVIGAAQLNEVVAMMPEGVNGLVGERGIKLSGGQRQRIGIARALYNQPELLILDEGTSALDSATESDVMASVAHLKGKLTIILVAHRYSTLHFCDIVYKMQNGVIVGKGKLEELV